MGEGWTGGASDIVKAESSGEDPRAIGGLVSNLLHPRVNKTKQHTHTNTCEMSLTGQLAASFLFLTSASNRHPCTLARHQDTLNLFRPLATGCAWYCIGWQFQGPPFTCRLKSVHALPTTHNVEQISYKSTSPCAQWARKGACNDISTWLPGFVYTPAAPHHHHVLYSSTILGRAAAQLYFRRKFGWFSLGLGHSSCLGFVLLKFLSACFF